MIAPRIREASNMTIQYAIGKCALGLLLLASSDIGVCAIALGDDTEMLIQVLRNQFPKVHLIETQDALAQMLAKVAAFIETPAADLDITLDIQGSVFQKKVWQALQEIPLGSTASYSAIARRIGAPKAARAVAAACAANKLAVVIPCHRVVRNNGSLSGYRWGVARKSALLEREKNVAVKV